MKLTKATDNKTEPTVQLGALEGGDVFRFSHLTFDEALKEDAFFIVLEAPEKQCVMIACLADGKQMARDKDHRVVKHVASLSIAA